MARRRQLRVLLGITVLWVGWTIWFVGTGGRTVEITVVDDEGAVVPGAVVSVEGSEAAVTDAQGSATVEWVRGREFEVSAPGYAVRLLDFSRPPDPEETVRIDARVLRGQAVDGEGRPVPDVRVEAGYGVGWTGTDGTFLVRLAEPGPTRVWRPGWERADFEWDGSPGERTLELAPRQVKAVHVMGEIPGDAARWAEMLELADSTELNGMTVDLKDEKGIVYYDTAVALAGRAGAVEAAYALADVVRAAEEHDLYLIGRVVAFQDPRAATAIPEMAVADAATGLPFQKGKHYFLDPTDTDARQYALALAEEACRAGFDEIQFDYVRYPDGFGENAVFDGGSDADARVATIRSFLTEARSLLNELGCAVAGDIFGFITTASDDGGIGQHWETVTSVLDVVSPMIYPSHYGGGWYGFETPNEHPGEVVKRALEDAVARLESAAVIRPWLQDFGYTDDQVRAQIDSAESLGLGWMLWNAVSEVSEGALR